MTRVGRHSSTVVVGDAFVDKGGGGGIDEEGKVITSWMKVGVDVPRWQWERDYE